MGVVQAYSACCGCGRPFFYNPVRVPSVRINGLREPVCPDCLSRFNQRRAAAGLEPVVPAADAYTAAEESEFPMLDD